MASITGSWVNLLAGIVGLMVLLYGILGLRESFSTFHTFVAVAGFLLLSWASLSYLRYHRGTAESEVDGGHTIE